MEVICVPFAKLANKQMSLVKHKIKKKFCVKVFCFVSWHCRKIHFFLEFAFFFSYNCLRTLTVYVQQRFRKNLKKQDRTKTDTVERTQNNVSCINALPLGEVYECSDVDKASSSIERFHDSLILFHNLFPYYWCHYNK